ncbi:MAG: T9SS type A sorting domain-containing protein [Candidatus Kapabacteria bacterium]|nr:T9SS type A sorting domain-containing protein [Ignavibacteriota bacterium]MCW5884053.1 T9SS type A sorting domain-containing protein [Candidatus Kapabacteria bacterium]
MKRYLFLIAVLLIGTHSLSAQEDPNLLWQTTDPLGYSGFVIHPNGNIIANRNCEFFEIDGNTGQQIRAFPVHYGFTTILSVSQSSDGKYFAAIYAGGGDSVLIFISDYETGEVYRKLKNIGDNLDFFPDSKRLLITTFDRGHPNASLSIYNIEDESFQNFGAGFPTEVFQKVSISNDGRYFATGGRSYGEDINGETIYNVHLRLWDAVTLKPIKELAKIGGNFEVRSIKFSPDGKYVGFHIPFSGTYIYNLQNFSLQINYYIHNLEYPPSASCFLPNDLFVMTSLANSENGIKRYNVIKDLKNDMTKYRYFGKVSSGLPPYSLLEFNSYNNSLVLTGGHLFAFDLNKMLTTLVDESPIKSVTVYYTKDTLILTGLNSISGQINITISDVSGRVVKKLDSPVSNTEIIIPLKLPNGTYLIHIQDGNQEFTSKFLVME